MKKIKKTKWKSIIRYMFELLKNNWPKTLLAFIGMLLVTFFEIIQPKLLMTIIDQAIGNSDILFLFILSGIYLFSSISIGVLNLVLGIFYSRVKKRNTVKLKLKILDRISKKSGSYYTESRTGNLLHTLQNDFSVVESMGVDLFFSLVMDSLKVAAAFIILIRMNIYLFLLIVSIQIAMSIIQSKLTKRISGEAKKVREFAGVSANSLTEYISNLMNIVITKGKRIFFKQYIKNEKEYINTSIKLEFLIALSNGIAYLVSNGMNILIFLLCGVSIINNEGSVGELLAYSQYTFMVLGPCKNLINTNNKIQQVAVSADKIYAVFDEPIYENNNKGIKCNIGGNVEFVDVSFGYIDGNQVLDHVSMQFQHKSVTALVGDSGGGKTTVSKLIFRLWDVQKGNILLDGMPIEKYNLRYLRKCISIVTQDVFLFNDTVFNNVILDSNASHQEAKHVCELIGIDKMVESLECKYDTVIGERGVKLSGGQKQRIAIARALLEKSSIIIFDEATSALDNISQEEIMGNIRDYIMNKTVVIIAHRLSTIEKADKIYVLSDGKVIQEGRHQDLLNQGGKYHELVKQV